MDLMLVALAAVTLCLVLKRVKTWKEGGFSFDLPSIGKILIVVGAILILMA